MNKVCELFGIGTKSLSTNWASVVAEQHCPYLNRKCIKVRKSQPEIAIGTCTLSVGRSNAPTMICPYRLLERRQVFLDCMHLLTKHEPGNELHILGEVEIPGGSIDYFLVSANARKVRDFVAIEFQTMDTTGTVWPERQRFLMSKGIKVKPKDVASTKPFGMNWKMTAKTVLVQLHHKVETFQHFNKHLVLVVQDHLLSYMKSEFNFGHLTNPASLGDAMHVHAYSMSPEKEGYRIQLAERLSTDVDGVSRCLGLAASPKMELELIIKHLEAKMTDETTLRLK